MKLQELVRFIEFVSLVKDKALQIKDKCNQKISVISNRISFQIYDRINNLKRFDILHYDSLGNIYYSNIRKVVYANAQHYSFIAFNASIKNFIVIKGNEIKREHIIDDRDFSIIRALQDKLSEKTFIIDRKYFVDAINYLIRHLQFIKENIDLLDQLYNDYKLDITKFLLQTKIIPNCFVKINYDERNNTKNDLNANYHMLLQHSIFYIVFPSTDFETRYKLNREISKLYYDIENLFMTYNLNTTCKIIDFETKPAGYTEFTTMSIVTYTIHFDEILDILLLSDFIKNIHAI